MVGQPGGPFLTHDDRFAEVLGDAPRLVKVVDAGAHEGPVYLPDEDALYFTTLPGAHGAAIVRLALDGDRVPLGSERLSVVREPGRANMPNGMTDDGTGWLLVCEQGTRTVPGRISRLDPKSGATETIVDGWDGRPLNSPNDVVIGRDGSIWFTDPSYGALQGFKDAPSAGDHVYRFDPRTGRLAVVADTLDKPNGLAFSPDGAVLYVGDSGAIHAPGDYSPARPHHVLAFDVRAGGRLSGGRLFARIEPGFPDGMEVDAAGRVYVSSSSGVQVFDPAGRPLGEIRVPGAVNFAFGGRDGTTLFITADTAIWTATLRARGARSWATPHGTPAHAGRAARRAARHDRRHGMDGTNGANGAGIATRKALTLAGAEAVARAAEAEASARGARVVVAVVDGGGVPIVLRRGDGAQVASVGVAIDKARTAAIFRRPSSVLEDQVREGRVGALGLAGGAALRGGLPIVVADQTVGAIGVSGETPAEDETIALAGAQTASAFA